MYCAARFHWRLSSTAHCQEQHGDRQQNSDRGESFKNCWHRVIFFTAVLRKGRCQSQWLQRSTLTDDRPSGSAPRSIRTIVGAGRCHYDARATLDRKRKVPSRLFGLLFRNLCAVCDVLLQNDF
jgi:hypothetical protein